MSSPPSSTAQMRLSELTSLIADTINRSFAERSYWVVAEVTDHTYKADKNYHFFSLVEKNPNTHEVLAKISGAAWGQGSLAIAEFKAITGQTFTNHLQVLVNVSVQFHAAYGLRLNLLEVDPNFTLGALARQRDETLRRLVAENPEFIQRAGDTYVTHNKRLVLNQVIQHIAVVCSRTSAGWQDFKHTLDNNPHRYVFRTDPYYTVVQGETNTQQLVEALIAVFRSERAYDAVVIIRGGGSQTDFLLFDQYLVGKAIAKFPIPVITGIGHQKNETIADLMANRVAKTPTEAAKLIIDHNRRFEENVQTLQQRILIRTQQRFTVAVKGISQLQASVVNRTRAELGNSQNKLTRLSAKLFTLVPILLQNQSGYLGHQVSLINALSPENTLKRGFAIIKVNNAVTGDADKVIVGEDIEILFAKTSVTATVKEKRDYNGTDFNV